MTDHHSLKSGTTLNQYKIIRVLGAGGFGITYLAEDTQLGMKVVIKEYFPNEFAVRKSDNTIIAKTSSSKDFQKGMQRFKEEAKTLAKFNHPSIVKILGYFEANDTAYFVMEYEEGIDLAQYLKQEKRALSQEEILSIMMPILEGLKEVHKYNYLHRDIKPANILLRANKSPVLIDFGASKLALGEASKSITSMLTEGYAPLEQYSTDIKQQGAFTDLYAVAAVMYKMITEEVPPSAQTRSYALLSGGNDPYKSLMTLKLSKYNENFLKAVDRTLDINANMRPQNVQEFQKDIAGQLEIEQNDTPKGKKHNIPIIMLIIVLIFSTGIYYFSGMNNQENEVKKSSEVVKADDQEVQQKISEKKLKVKGQRKEHIEKVQKEKNALVKKSAITIIGNKMWQDDPMNNIKKVNWKEAIKYCSDLMLGGYNDWQLPDIGTLQELYKNKDKMHNLLSSEVYWSKTPMIENNKYAWRMYFKGGYDNVDMKHNKYFVRCVRDK